MNARFGQNVGEYPYMAGSGILAMTPEKIAGATVIALAGVTGVWLYSRRRKRRRRKRRS